VTNYAVRIYFSEIKIADNRESLLCSAASQKLLNLFSTSSVFYLRDQGLFQQRYYCRLIEPDHFLRGNPMLLVMVQVDKVDNSLNLISLMVSAQTYNLQAPAGGPSMESYAVIEQILPSTSPTFSHVVNNSEQLCITGKTPNENRVGCICDKGYEASGVRCLACQQGTFKATAGGGSCVPCESGKTSGIAASSCTATGGGGGNVDLNPPKSGGSSDGNLPLIIGGVVGGVLFVIILVYGYMRFMNS